MGYTKCTECGKPYWAPTPPGAHLLCGPCKEIKFSPPKPIEEDEYIEDEDRPTIVFTKPPAKPKKK